ncbi:MAG: hypothetical protein V4440_13540, partial [Pseudomonadota bacterium]
MILEKLIQSYCGNKEDYWWGYRVSNGEIAIYLARLINGTVRFLSRLVDCKNPSQVIEQQVSLCISDMRKQHDAEWECHVSIVIYNYHYNRDNYPGDKTKKDVFNELSNLGCGEIFFPSYAVFALKAAIKHELELERTKVSDELKKFTPAINITFPDQSSADVSGKLFINGLEIKGAFTSDVRNISDNADLVFNCLQKKYASLKEEHLELKKDRDYIAEQANKRILEMLPLKERLASIILECTDLKSENLILRDMETKFQRVIDQRGLLIAQLDFFQRGYKVHSDHGMQQARNIEKIKDKIKELVDKLKHTLTNGVCEHSFTG